MPLTRIPTTAAHRGCGQRMWCVVLVVVSAMVPRDVHCFTLTILHTNDVHARYEQTNSYSGQCTERDLNDTGCYGGFPRIRTKVEELRALYSNTVLVDAGDQYQGTIWFFKYGGNVTAHFMNAIGYDVMALGNHEFDNGVPGLRVLTEMATFPIISSNINASSYPDIHATVRPSVVLEVGGERVGFVGYTTTDTLDISDPELITFNDEVESVRSEVERLTREGVNKIVCVGHAGFTKDLRLAAEVPGVDVVVGGHTNTFLYTGTPPANEEPAGDYPQVVNQEDGSQVLVVQDYAFGKYLGFLQVDFDDAGQVTSWSGNPILLNGSVARDAELARDLAGWRVGVDALTQQVIGRSAVFLQGLKAVCRQQECNLGNLIADAMVMQNLRHSDGIEWNHVAIAILNSGGIRAPIAKGDITVADIVTVQPFRSTVDIVEVTGVTLRQILEHSASEWHPVDLNGGFLQVSGLQIVYNMTMPHGQKVAYVKVRCADCEIPQFVDLEPSKVYKVILPSYLAGGGDGYSVIPDNALRHHVIGDLDSDVLIEYISKYSPITHGLEGRIRFLDNETPKECPTSRACTSQPLLTFTLVCSVTLTATYIFSLL